jgi:membrane-bound lytic murein transglycosylase D
MNKPVILAAGTPQVLLPYDNATLFVRNLRAHQAPLATWTAWVAPATLKPADVARQVGMSEAELRAVNRIPPRMLVKAGSTLLVPRNGQRSADVPEQIADNARMLLAPEQLPGKRIVFKAGKGGDTVAAVARRYRVSAEQVAQWNNVDASARFRPGQTIVVVKAAPAKRNTRSVSASKAKPASASAALPARSAKATRPAAKVAGTKPDSSL